MGRADKLFTDGEAYERLMGRWSRLVGEIFLGWLDVPKGLRWLESAVAMVPLPKRLLLAVPRPQ